MFHLQTPTMAASFNETELYKVTRVLVAMDLEQDMNYKLTKLVRVQAKFGETLMAYLEMADGEKTKIYLPQAYAKQLTDDDLAKINSDLHDLVLVGPYLHSYKYKLVPREH